MGHFTINWIASKIKALRKQQNLSLQELSNHSKISKGLLSKIENSRTIPSLPVFINLLESLKTSPKDFFEDLYTYNNHSFEVIRKNDRQKIEKENRTGFIYHDIFNQNFSDLNVNIVYLTIEPNAQYEPAVTDGYEFKIVLKGFVEYFINGESVILEEGDAIFFDARQPHYPKANSVKAELLVIYFLLA